MTLTGHIIIVGFIATALFSNVWTVTGHIVNAGWMFSSWGGMLLWGIGLLVEITQLIDKVGKKNGWDKDA